MMVGSRSSIFKPYIFSSTYGYLLVIAGIWAYFDTGVKSQFIAVILGVVLLIMNNGVQYGTKEAKYVALVTTGLSLYVVSSPLSQYLYHADNLSIARTGIMLAVGMVSLLLLSYDVFIAKQVKTRKRIRGKG